MRRNSINRMLAISYLLLLLSVYAISSFAFSFPSRQHYTSTHTRYLYYHPRITRSSITDNDDNKYTACCFRPAPAPSSVSRCRSTETPSQELDDDDSSNDKSQQEQQLSRAYNIGTYVFGGVAALLLILPDRTLSTLLATKWGSAAGWGLASFLCHILRGANDHHRLGSDTYLRLNIGLLGFFALGLTAIPGEAGFTFSPAIAMGLWGVLELFKVFGTGLAFVGWKRGIVGKSNESLTVKKMVGRIVQGYKVTFTGLKVQSNKKALTYRNCLLLVGMGMVSSFMEGIFNMRYQKEFTRTFFEISLEWSAVARLFMIGTMIYSLKDAAERDRLTGTTFIQLNIMVGTWALLVGLGQSFYALGFAAYRGVEMYAFAMPFFLKAYKSYKEKRDKHDASKMKIPPNL